MGYRLFRIAAKRMSAKVVPVIIQAAGFAKLRICVPIHEFILTGGRDSRFLEVPN